MKKVLILINTFGELEWIAPVIYKLQKDKIIELKVLFNVIDKEEVLAKNKQLRSLLDSDDFYDYTSFFPKIKFLVPRSNNYLKRFLNRLFKNLINIYPNYFTQQIFKTYIPDILFHDIGANTGLRDSLKKIVSFSGGSVIVFPHGSEVFVEEGPNFLDFNPNYLLCSSKFCSDVYKNNYPNAASEVIGIPKLDEFWIKKMANKQERISKSLNVYFITRGPHPSDLSQKSFDKIMNGVMSVVSDYPDAILHVKSHPRYTQEQISEIADNYLKLNWQITDRSILEMHNQIDIVISMWSSLIIDSISLGLPVIEYFLFEDSTHKWFKKDGVKMTGYEKFKLVKNVKSEEELKKELDFSLLNREIITENAKKTLEYYLPEDTKESTNKILQLIKET